MVLKANDRRTSCPCHDEFRGPRSDYVRQVALATTTTQQHKYWCLGVTEFPHDHVFSMNRLHFSTMSDLIVLIVVLHDSLCFIKVNGQNIKKYKRASVRSLLYEVETNQAREEHDEIMDINHDNGSKFEKSAKHMILLS
ncbi:hypothetical protein TNCV_441351 [Trichonephila clavipes]|nr:hypothetical protein TNCV_441351 [Trichonephila clavipes]